MSNLGQYNWLTKETGPRILVEAVKLFGTVEAPGKADNPTIIAWAKELGLKDYVHDEIAWCGLFVATCAKRAGFETSDTPLWALSWAEWGSVAWPPMLGDVLVFKREGGGHVGIYVGEDTAAYHVLGGNQSDQVKVSRIAKSRLFAARRCAWRVAQPANVRTVTLSAVGALSTNEA